MVQYNCLSAKKAENHSNHIENSEQKLGATEVLLQCTERVVLITDVQSSQRKSIKVRHIHFAVGDMTDFD